MRPAHVEHLQRHAAKLLAAGSLLAADDNAAIGSLIIFDSDDQTEVDAFLVADPYAKGGLFQTVEVQSWRKVFLDDKPAG